MFYDREHSGIRRDLSIDIEHVGPSAAQVFAGEFVEDKKAMQKELVRGLEGQEQENKELLEREAALERAFAELSKLDFETRLAIDTEEEASRRAARRALDEYNAELQRGRKEKQKRDSQYSKTSAMRDIDFHLHRSELLNGDIGTSSDFKGVSLKGKQDVLDSQAQQVEQRIRRVTEENDRTARDAAQAEAQRLEAVRIHDEQENQRRSAAKALVEENMRLAEDQNRVRMRTEETYAPSIKETFFDQFAKSACH
ncbi:conserved hypothetical protein [Perkinsus marinus ATCC 50983]|uniref:Uncharacterized protein n=1 Tax=Perkinsus marinus (strain ATCC 50983 / TXsc) TaxID=423536 RepID=C5KC27_PERM5|nr:conserved hypothetical protein [Perkinsus marinus ATCC 50983]EER18058.1 conserved hypothetical protein [Perkinsus marinus ATCC 50983]|eukprot:XP_002786262.1 conserved hypothetical protein [Perkinsus marinus ATCC 50983]